MGIAITLAQYLVNGGIEYDLVPHPHTETASASAAASQVPADSVAKAVVLKGGDGFMLAVLPPRATSNLTSSSDCLAARWIWPMKSRSRRFLSIANRVQCLLLAPHMVSMSLSTTVWHNSLISISRGVTTPIWSMSPGQVFRS